MGLYEELMAKQSLFGIGGPLDGHTKLRNNRLDWSKHKRRKKDRRRAKAKRARFARRINRD